MCIKIRGMMDHLIIEDPEGRQQQLMLQQRIRLNLLVLQQHLLQYQREILQQQDMLQQQLTEVMQQQANLLRLSTIPFPLLWIDSPFNISGVNQSTTPQVPETITASQVPLPEGTTLPEYMDHDQQESSTHVPQNQTTLQLSITKQIVIWNGVLEWFEYRQSTNTPQQIVQAPFQVETNLKSGEPYVSGVSWPEKLVMRCFPSYLLHKMGRDYLNNSKFVLFNPLVCEATESLIKFLSKGFVGYVHFAATSNNCNIQMLLLLYSVAKQMFIGIIPNNQPAFINQLRKVVRHEKILNAMIRQGPHISRPSRMDNGSSNNDTNVIPNRASTEISQNRILTSQTNTVTADDSRITQNNNQKVSSLAKIESAITNINIEDVEIFNQQRHIDVIIRKQIYEETRQHNSHRISELQQRIQLLQQQEANIQRYLNSQGLEMQYELEDLEDSDDSDSDSDSE